MRTCVIAFALVVGSAAAAGAQDWELYTSVQDGFKIDFPGTPKISETTWKTEQGYVLPARVYTVERGREKYSMMVADYSGIEKMGMERAAKCPPGAETCQGQRQGNLQNVIGPGYATQDIRGAIVYATAQLLKRDVKLTHYLWNWMDLVEGHELHLINNADESKTMAFIAMRENRLYIMEGTVPKGYPEPGLFYQSLGWVDKAGNGVRYQYLYVNEIYGLGLYPPPPYNAGGQGGGAPPAGARGTGAAPQGRGGAAAPAGAGR